MHHDDSQDSIARSTPAPRTVEQFTTDAVAFVTRHGSNVDVFTRHMTDWKNSGHDPVVLGQNIRSILEFISTELAKRQFRSDGSKERRLQIIADMEMHVTEDYVDHLKQTIIGDELVEWCDEYVTHTTTPPTP